MSTDNITIHSECRSPDKNRLNCAWPNMCNRLVCDKGIPEFKGSKWDVDTVTFHKETNIDTSARKQARLGIHDCNEQRCPKHCCSKQGCPHPSHCKNIKECKQTGVALKDLPSFMLLHEPALPDKPNLVRDALQEFPFAQYALAYTTKEALKKHKPRDWREKDLTHFTGKIGRHIARCEIDGEVNKAEGNQLHMVAAAWSLMAYVDTMLRRLSESNGDMEPSELLRAIKDGSIVP